MEHFKTLPFKKASVFLRADLNVPLSQSGAIADDFKCRMLVPTLDFLLAQNPRSITICTHLGRPAGIQPHLSTAPLAAWFATHGYPLIQFAQSPAQALQIMQHTPQKPTLILLENVRFFPGEQTHDLAFAQELANLGSVYINDAFGLIHRLDTSVCLLASLYPLSHKALGPLITRERAALDHLSNPQQPLVVMVGGNKALDKITLLERFLKKANNPHGAASILLGGTLGQLAALIQHTHTQSTQKSAVETAIARFLEQAQHSTTDVIIPSDFIVDNNGMMTTLVASALTPSSVCYDIGPQTIDRYAQHIQKATTIFANGPLGKYEDPNGQAGTKHLLNCINTRQWSCLGGGDIVAAALQFGMSKAITHLSTGGGASLAYLTAHNPAVSLPALHNCLTE